MSKTVGVVGLGAMGSAMAIMLVKAGFEVVGFDLRDAALDELEENGGKRANSPRDVADLTVQAIIDETFLVLPHPEVLTSPEVALARPTASRPTPAGGPRRR